MSSPQPVANGLRTDHPVPDLPFVDDSVLPLDDPAGIEAIGRGAGEGMWGRYDGDPDGEWQAFTTDPVRRDLAWSVRRHPDHGTSVLLFRDDDASGVQMDWWEDQPLLYRSGGYWWDGTTWYRPAQVWDAPSEKYERRPARSAVTVTADDLLDDTADPGRGAVLEIAGFDPDAAPSGRWTDHLALWAARRTECRGSLPLSACVVRLSAPELAADQLISAAELAEAGGIAASTLRAYISRGEAEVPLPQALVGGRAMWSRPVARDWSEARHRSPENVAEAMASGPDSPLSVGAADVHRRYTKMFAGYLWENPERRKRWALRHRNEATVGQTADELAWMVAADLKKIIPAEALAVTVRHALLDELADSKRMHNGSTDQYFYGIGRHAAKMLDWLIRHFPNHGQQTIAETIREAERQHQIPRDLTAQSLRTALSLDSTLTPAALADFLDRVLPAKT